MIEFFLAFVLISTVGYAVYQALNAPITWPDDFWWSVDR